MAYIPNNSVISYSQASGQGTNFVFPEPLDAQVGDFICFTVMNVSAAGSAMTASGYSNPTGATTTTISGVSRVQAFYREVTSLPVGNVTVVGQDAEFLAEVFLVRKADLTTPFDVNVVPTDFTSNGASQTVAGITTTNNNCLIVYSSHLRTSGKQLPAIASMDDVVFLDKYASGVLANSLIGYRIQRTAGAAPSLGTINNIASTSTGRAFTFAFRDVAPSTPTLPPEVSTNYEVIRLHMGTSGAGTPTDSFSRNETTTWADGNTVAATTIDGLSIIAASPTMTQVAFNDNNNESIWGSSTVGSIGVSGVDATGRWVGFTHSITSTDMSGKIFALTFGMNSITFGNVGAKGCIVYFEDSTGEWAAFTLSKRDGMQINVPYTSFIALGSATPLDESGAIDWTDITDMAFYYHRVTTNTAARAMYIRLAVLIGEPVVYGGSEDSPITTSFLSRVMQGWAGFNLAPNQVREQLAIKGSFTIGNGTNKTVANFTEQSIIQPSLPDGSFDGQFYQGAANTLTTKFNTSSDDIIILDGATISSPQSGVNQILDLSTGSAPASFSANGTPLGGQVITGGSGKPFNRTRFRSCGLIDLNGSTMDNCLVTNSNSTPAVLAADPEDISNTDFISAGTGHAIEITIPGTYDFFGNTFAGYGADTTTDAAIYNNSGGLVTLNLAAGDATPTYRDGAGASTAFDTPSVDINVNDYLSGSRVQIYNTTQATEIYNDEPSGTDFGYTVTSEADDDDLLLIKVTKLGRQPFRQVATFSATTGASVTVEQPEDEIYTLYGIDGSAVTEYDWDGSDLEIDLDDPSGGYDPRGLWAWYSYFITTEVGIRDVFGLVTAVNAANIRLENIYVDNLSADSTYPNQDIRIYREDGAYPQKPTTTGGGGIGFYADGEILATIVNTTGTPVITGDIADVPTVAEIADGVWDETKSGHTTAGTFGKSVADTEDNAELAAIK